MAEIKFLFSEKDVLCRGREKSLKKGERAWGTGRSPPASSILSPQTPLDLDLSSAMFLGRQGWGWDLALRRNREQCALPWVGTVDHPQCLIRKPKELFAPCAAESRDATHTPLPSWQAAPPLWSLPAPHVCKQEPRHCQCETEQTPLSDNEASDKLHIQGTVPAVRSTLCLESSSSNTERFAGTFAQGKGLSRKHCVW